MGLATDAEISVAEHFASRATAAAYRDIREVQDRKFVEAIARGMAILQAFGRRTGPLGNSDLHELTGLSKPTVTRLTHTLVTLGYLRRTRSSRFQLSPGIMTLGRPLSDAVAARLPTVALNTIASAGPWCIAIAEPTAEALVVTASFNSYQAGAPACPIGTCLDLSLTSAGHAFIATLALDAHHIHMKRHDAPSVEIIAAARAQLLGKGFCFEAGGWRRGIATVAVPITTQLSASRVVMAAASDEPAMRERLTRDFVPAIKNLFP
jgi:DNA-binding IclR family transcriptional regulator